MRYQEYDPPEYLQPWVKCFWVFEGHYDCLSAETIVADGYPELIVHYGNPYLETPDDGDPQPQPRVVACGQITGPLLLYCSGWVGITAIRFQPAGMVPFTRESMNAMVDLRCPADELFTDVRCLEDGIRDALDDRNRINACVRFLDQQWQPGFQHGGVQLAISRILESAGCQSVDLLASEINMSRRNLELVFRKQVGLSPKKFSRVIRFQRAYELLTQRGGPAAQVALDSGYFDQAHLIRDFRQFAGATPASFLERDMPLSHAITDS